MSAGYVPPDGSGSPFSQFSPEVIARMKVGESVDAVVSRDLGEGKYRINVGGTSNTVQSEVPLEVRQAVRLEAVEHDGRMMLRVSTDSAGPGQTAGTRAEQANLVRSLDQATLPAPFRLGVDSGQVTVHMTGKGEVAPAVGIVSSGEGVAVHFPDGAVVSATVYAGRATQPEAATNAQPAQPATGNSSEVLHVPTPASRNEAAQRVAASQSGSAQQEPAPTTTTPAPQSPMASTGETPQATTGNTSEVTPAPGSGTGESGQSAQARAGEPLQPAAVATAAETAQATTGTPVETPQPVATESNASPPSTPPPPAEAAQPVPASAGTPQQSMPVDAVVPAHQVQAVLPANGEGVFLVEQIAFPVRLDGVTPGGMVATVNMDPSALAAVAADLAAGTAEITIPFPPQEANVVLANLAGARVLLHSDMSMQNIPVGEAIPLRLEGEAILGGALRVESPGASLQTLGDIDRQLIAAGLSVSEHTREAARALLAEGLPVTRQAVAQLTSLAAGFEGADREGILAAGARLLARELPLTVPLAAGLSQILSGDASVTDRLGEVMTLLNQVSADSSATIPALPPLMDQALSALRALAVQLDGNEPPRQIADFLATLGRQQLAQADASLRDAAQAALSGNSGLRNADAALSALASATQGAAAPSAETMHTGQGLPAPQPLSDSSTVPLTPPPVTPLTLPELDALGSRLSRLVREVLPPESSGQASQTTQATSGEQNEAVTALRIARALLDAPSPERAMAAARELVERGSPELVRAVRFELERIEGDLLRAHSTIERLADAAEAVRDLGRRFLAYRAETLAGTRQDPGVLVSEIPFRMQGEDGNGRLQVFYRRGERKGRSRWSARVVLDLETTNLGPVVGDLRFKDKNLRLNMFAKDEATAAYLSSAVEDLSGALRTKGFTLEPSFLVIPPSGEPTIHPEPFAGRAIPKTTRPRLDIEA